MRAKVESDDPDGKLSLPPAFLYQVLQSDLHFGGSKGHFEEAGTYPGKLLNFYT